MLPFCKLLKLEVPSHYESDEARLWNELGRDLMRNRADEYRAIVSLLHVMLGRKQT